MAEQISQTGASGVRSEASQKTMRLGDARGLGYAEYGDPAGKPIFYFHGWPSSRLEAWNYHAAGSRLGARIIGVDRPGIGLSSYKRGYKISDWPDDVAALADSLGIERFGVVGISSGAPYSYARARFIQERLTGAAVVSGVGPLDIPEPGKYVLKDELRAIWVARRTPWLARILFGYLFSRMARNPEKSMAKMIEHMPESDREILTKPDRDDGFSEALKEMGRHGMRGAVQTIALEGRPWGFTLEEVRMKVHVFHGEADSLAFPETARYVSGRLPNCQLHLYPGDGHIATVINRADDVIKTLLA
ncbi:MAG: alpha/beta hydrolase [Chloroflexi bacterium]|nr:MAG: alpha/beta hydrolase [Chloroflexota bacterium]